MKHRIFVVLFLILSVMCFSRTAFAESVAPDVNLGMGSVSHEGSISRPGTFYPELYFKKGEGYVNSWFTYSLSSFPTNIKKIRAQVTVTAIGHDAESISRSTYLDAGTARIGMGLSVRDLNNPRIIDITKYMGFELDKPTTTLKVIPDSDNDYSVHFQIEVNLIVTGSQPPSNLSASKSTTSLNLYWSANGNNPGTVYEVYQGSTLLGTTTSTSYNVAGLSPGTYYTFKVRATYTDNPPSNYASAGFYTLPVAPAVSVDSGGLDWSQVAGRGYAKLSWPAVTGANGYYVYIHDGNSYQKFSVGGATS